jgi:hypothetical protein
MRLPNCLVFSYIFINVAHILLNCVWFLEHCSACCYFDVLHDHRKFVRDIMAEPQLFCVHSPFRIIFNSLLCRAAIGNNMPALL